MPRHARPRAALLAVLLPLGLALLGLAPPARAATAQLASVEELARGSDAVVRGVVEGREARYTPDGRLIYTFVSIRSTQVWRGPGAARFTVRVPGGEVGSIGMKVAGAATFATGEEVVVFLKRSGEVHQVTGLAQGKFVVEGATVRCDLSGLNLVGRAPLAGELRPGAMPLAELERRVRSVP